MFGSKVAETISKEGCWHRQNGWFATKISVTLALHTDVYTGTASWTMSGFSHSFIHHNNTITCIWFLVNFLSCLYHVPLYSATDQEESVRGWDLWKTKRYVNWNDHANRGYKKQIVSSYLSQPFNLQVTPSGVVPLNQLTSGHRNVYIQYMQQVKLHVQAEKDNFDDLWYDCHPVIEVINIVDISSVTHSLFIIAQATLPTSRLVLREPSNILLYYLYCMVKRSNKSST